MDRKYKQRGYMDSDAPQKREKHQTAPRPKQEQFGPRTPRMVGTITRARCSNCGAVLQAGFDPQGKCKSCGFDFHCCKQCMYFDSGARFECMKPVPDRVARKDTRNECTFYAFRMTVEKDTAPTAPASSSIQAQGASRPTDARQAFEDLFKK
ncbi:MAG TPA: hypothetical protein VEH50_12585 [Methylomirabilota bacterium]|nr:hypothetical protein [Methylomirabilota bacterium]